jgi:LmbE family N-acetylglucosaminyl deacetylase
VTNGDSEARGRSLLRICGARRGFPSRVAAFGLRRNREAIDALAVLGLRWSPDPRRTDIFFLGYPNSGLQTIAGRDERWDGTATGLPHTYAYDGGRRSGGGDLRSLLDGQPSQLRAKDLARDLDALLELCEPADVYTHAEFDGHPDHAETYRQVVAATRRLGARPTLHLTLIHPDGSGDRMYDSALEWPNPCERDVATPFDRFRPDLPFDAPPPSWGPWGEPDELVEVPASMQSTDPDRNLKWQAISCHASQILCRPDGSGRYHASCGYMRAFVKRHEFFWTRAVV